MPTDIINGGSLERDSNTMISFKKPTQSDPDSESPQCEGQEIPKNKERSFSTYSIASDNDLFYRRQQEMLQNLRKTLKKRRVKRDSHTGTRDLKQNKEHTKEFE